MLSMEFIIRITFAFLLGGAIGLERQKRQRMAGVRTNVLVSLGAFLFVTLSVLIEGETSPTRMAAQVVSGIGFLGAGVILREGMNVRGLNTAATLWCSAAIGVLTANGFIMEASVGTLFILFANISLRKIVRKLTDTGEDLPLDELEFHYLISVDCKEEVEFHIRSLLIHMIAKEDLVLSYLKSEDKEGRPNDVEVFAEVIGHKKSSLILEDMASRLSLETKVSSVGWKAQI